MFQSKTELADAILSGVISCIKDRATEIIKEHSVKASEEIEKAVREEIGHISINLSKSLSFERVGTRITFSIEDSRPK